MGVDLGIKTDSTLSNGKVFPSVKAYQTEAKLSGMPRLNRHKIKGFLRNATQTKKTGSLAQLKIARLHRRTRNIRQDALHKLTTYLAKNHGTEVN